jgi:DNA repair exonuclease SbcCD ATPase subunit
MTQEQWRGDQGAILARLREQRIALAEVEETLGLQRLALEELLAALEEARPESENSEHAAEIALLRQQLQERDALLEELQGQPATLAANRDSAAYEAELTEFRRQLEGDRQKFNKEVEQLRARNKELDEATREMELEMSRERAELARERQRLERLRDDTRQELERMQRDAGLRDRLSPVQSLRDEINHRRHPGTDQPARPTAEEAMQARLRVLRNKMNE